MKKIFAISSVLLLSTWLSGQKINGIEYLIPSTTSNVSAYSNGYFEKTSDNGFVSCFDAGGGIMLVKIDSLGQTTWAQGNSFSGFSVARAVAEGHTAGNYYVVGFRRSGLSDNKLFLAHFDNMGQLLTSYSYETEADLRGDDIYADQSGIYLFGTADSSGLDVSQGKGGRDVWITRVDYQGNIQWERSYGGSGSDVLSSMVKMPNGFLAVCSSTSMDGDVSNPSGGDIWLLRIDSTGNILWDKSIVAGSTPYAINTNDNNILLFGRNYQFGAGQKNLWAAKMDTTGAIIWENTYGSRNTSWLGQVAERSNGNLVFSSGAGRAGMDISIHYNWDDIWMFETDSLGNLLWERTYGGTGQDKEGGVALPTDSTIVLLGYTSSNDMIFTRSATNTTAVLLRIDESNSIQGKVFCDLNQNGIWDNNENPYNVGWARAASATDTSLVNPTVLGDYRFFISRGSWDISFAPTLTYWNSGLGTVNRTYTTVGNYDTLDIPVVPVGNVKDLEVTLMPITVSRPGFQARYAILYRNIGNQTISGASVRLLLDGNATFTSSDLAEDSVRGQWIYWSLGNLAPFDRGEIDVEVSLDQPPLLDIGDTLEYISEAYPLVGDQSVTNNTDELRVIAQGSYDPNNKLESHGGFMKWSKYANGDLLHYTLNFQNTGTDTAFTVVIHDTLTTLLDASSFQFTASSHECQTRFLDGNVLEFTFNNILLPDSMTDPEGSKGFVLFSISPETNLTLMDTIKNKVGIFFDFNPPIITNTSVTIFLQDIGLNEDQLSQLEIYPNPSSEQFQLLSSGNFVPLQIEIYDLQGRKVQSMPIGGLERFDVSDLRPGSYILSVADRDGKEVRLRFIRK